MERRVLLAITLSFLVLFLFQRFVTPPPSDTRPQASPNTGAATGTGVPVAQSPKPAVVAPEPTAAPSAPTPSVSLTVGDANERTITVETETVRAVFTNRGARLVKWVLKGYRGEGAGELDLVPSGPGETATKPFSLNVDDPAHTQALNAALYRVDGVSGDSVVAGGKPVTLQFEMATAEGLTAHKTFTLQPIGYVISFGVAIHLKQQQLNPQVQWGPGLGDEIARTPPPSFFTPAYNTPAQAILHKDDSAERPASPGGQNGAFLYAGVNDQYFASLLLNDRSAPAPFHFEHGPTLVPYGSDPSMVGHYENYSIRFGSPLEAMRFFFGPKAFDELRAIDPELV
ncbi:MAG: membrane protein insertase YidC, partial [Vicinamibacterales bacterium]